MGFKRICKLVIKKLRLERELANEYASIKQYLTGAPNIAEMSNEEVRILVANRAIEYSFNQPDGLLNILTEIATGSRINGANSQLGLYPENWERLVSLVEHLRRWKGLDELDLAEYCLAIYCALIKERRCLP
jgi:hypothetical protein